MLHCQAHITPATKYGQSVRGFLPHNKEVPTRLAHKASKEVLTQVWGKKTAQIGRI